MLIAPEMLVMEASDSLLTVFTYSFTVAVDELSMRLS